MQVFDVTPYFIWTQDLFPLPMRSLKQSLDHQKFPGAQRAVTDFSPWIYVFASCVTAGNFLTLLPAQPCIEKFSQTLYIVS